MEPEAKYGLQLQCFSVALVVIGLACTFAGCRYHYSELTTAAVGVVGAGLGLITGRQSSNTLNNRAGGTIAVGTPDPTV